MALKISKPTSPGRRFMTGYNFDEITKDKPEKSLIVPIRKRAGRNNQGRITVRHRGSGCKRMLRLIDFKREKVGIPAIVLSIEYDPNRSSRIALLEYEDKEKRYILAPLGLQVGDRIVSSDDADIKPGNSLPLSNIPVGTMVHNVELIRGQGGKLVRTAGTAAQMVAKEGEFVLLRMPSGEMRKIHRFCRATIGQIGNIEHQNISLGKAGRKRLMGWRPTVRGSAMSPRDHPHGGGEGRCPIGMPGPKTPWGKPTLGYKTRKKTKSSKMIVSRRK